MFQRPKYKNDGVPCDFGGFFPNTAIEGVSAWLVAQEALSQVMFLLQDVCERQKGLLRFDLASICFRNRVGHLPQE